MSNAELCSQIEKLRSVIRYHRGQVSDYRCWVDDDRLYQSANLAGYKELKVPPPDVFLPRCEAYWDKRQREHEKGKGDPQVSSAKKVLSLPVLSNSDLTGKANDQLRAELSRLEAGIRLHESKGYLGRTVKDDEVLYALLPETVEWNSALPAREVFLPNCGRFCDHCQHHPENFLEWSEDAPS